MRPLGGVGRGPPFDPANADGSRRDDALRAQTADENALEATRHEQIRQREIEEQRRAAAEKQRAAEQQRQQEAVERNRREQEAEQRERARQMRGGK